MKNLMFLILAVSMASCSLETEYKIHPKMVDYVNNFYDEAAKHGVQLSKDNLIVTMADCERSYSTKDGHQRIVVISIGNYTNHINDSLEYKNEALVAHELGHALLNLDHTNEISLMSYDYIYTSLFRNDCVQDIYYDQLFTGRELTDDEIWSVYVKCL